MANRTSSSERETGGRRIRGEPKKLRPTKGADGGFGITATLVQGVPLPPEAILTFFPDLAVKANDPNFS